MRPYLAVLRVRFRMLLQYRIAALAGVGTQMFWGLIRVMIFEAFYRSTTAPQPIDLAGLITYIWLGQAMLGLVLVGLDPEVRAMIRTGAVAYELARPLDLYGFWYVRAVANRVAPTLLRSVPIFIVAGTLFGLRSPPTLPAAAAWIACTAGAVLLGAAVWTLATVTLLWTTSGDGIARWLPAFAYLLSGSMVPLPLFPDWAQYLLHAFPFRGMVDVPFRFYLGHLPVERLPLELGLQLAWTLTLVLAGRALMARAMGRLAIQGG